VRTRAEYDRRIDTIRRRAWGGRDLPFGVLLDRPDPRKADDRDPEGTGTTVSRYGIQGFPTLLVIDGNGTIVDQVGHWEHARLESLVEGLLEKLNAR
jgi:hypothetical protein